MDLDQALMPRIRILDADPSALADHAFELVGHCGGAQQAIDALLEEAGLELSLDDIVIKEITDDATAMKINYEWNRDGQKLLLNLERRFLSGVFDTWRENFERNAHSIYLYDNNL